MGQILTNLACNNPRLVLGLSVLDFFFFWNALKLASFFLKYTTIVFPFFSVPLRQLVNNGRKWELLTYNCLGFLVQTWIQTKTHTAGLRVLSKENSLLPDNWFPTFPMLPFLLPQPVLSDSLNLSWFLLLYMPDTAFPSRCTNCVCFTVNRT